MCKLTSTPKIPPLIIHGHAASHCGTLSPLPPPPFCSSDQQRFLRVNEIPLLSLSLLSVPHHCWPSSIKGCYLTKYCPRDEEGRWNGARREEGTDGRKGHSREFHFVAGTDHENEARAVVVVVVDATLHPGRNLFYAGKKGKRLFSQVPRIALPLCNVGYGP